MNSSLNFQTQSPDHDLPGKKQVRTSDVYQAP
jgi:hypothetical protein